VWRREIVFTPIGFEPEPSSPYGVAVPNTLSRSQTVLKSIRNCALNRLFSLGGVIYPQVKRNLIFLNNGFVCQLIIEQMKETVLISKGYFGYYYVLSLF